MTLGLREGVIGLIVLVALYMAFVVWRMRELEDRRGDEDNETSAIDIHVGDETDEDIPPQESRREPLVAPVAPGHLADAILIQGLEREIAQLHDEVDALRGELAALRSDVQKELAVMRAAQTVSPVYGDAMQLAISGYDADKIAERCGIARAEAELVAALARSRDEAIK